VTGCRSSQFSRIHPDDSMPVKVAVKYCGGCNPEYDRIALVEEIKEKLEGRAVFVSPGSGDADLILAVEGCKTACADLSPFEGLPVRVITCREDAHRFIREIRNKSSRSWGGREGCFHPKGEDSHAKE